MLISYCVVNTDGRELLLRCLEAIFATAVPGADFEVLVLDNASTDGSADAVLAFGRDVHLIALDQRSGKAYNDSLLLKAASGRYCLLLNEDSELCPGAAAALVTALDADPAAGAAGAQLLSPDGSTQPCAWRLPSVTTALAGALFLHRRLTVQSGGLARRVGWAQSSAMLVRRRAAEEVAYLDPAFFVYSDETDFCKRLGERGWHTLYVPTARAVHREQLATDRAAASRRIVEFHRNRDRYMRKHHSRAEAATVRALTAWSYLMRALAAIVLPHHDASRYLLHVRQALRPWRGEGLSDAVYVMKR